MFFGGRDPILALDMMDAAKRRWSRPFELSVLADPAGSFTTAAAMIAVVEKRLSAEGLDLAGRRVAVFGATGPVGLVAALIAAQEGAKVSLVGYDGPAGDRVLREFEERFGVAMSLRRWQRRGQEARRDGGAEVILACRPGRNSRS